MNTWTPQMPDLSAYQHIIWDWNGTLLDDAVLCMDIVNGLLIEQGREPMTIEAYREIFDIPVIRYYEKLGIEGRFHDHSVSFMKAYGERRSECRLFPESRNLLSYFKKKGLSQSILSAYPQEMLETIIDQHTLREFFTHIFGHADIYAESKIGNGHRLIKTAGVTPQATLMIGDTYHDYEVAQELCISCILVACGHFSAKRLEPSGVPVFPDMASLQQLLVA